VGTRIETPRLVIRTFGPRDAGAWIAMVNDPAVNRFQPPTRDATMEAFQQVLERRHAREREIGYAVWAVDDKTTGTFAGQCGIRPVEGNAGPEIDLAYDFAKVFWNKGYGTEAVIAVLAHGLGPLGLDRIMALARPENIGSWRVMEKAGMRYEGIVDSYGLEGLKKYVADGEWWRPPHDRR
jgi:RimJ/RimL family protein N-acetyltransferase